MNLEDFRKGDKVRARKAGQWREGWVDEVETRLLQGRALPHVFVRFPGETLRVAYTSSKYLVHESEYGVGEAVQFRNVITREWVSGTVTGTSKEGTYHLLGENGKAQILGRDKSTLRRPPTREDLRDEELLAFRDAVIEKNEVIASLEVELARTRDVLARIREALR